MQVTEIGVAADVVILFLNDAHGDVGAVVRDTFHVGQQIAEDEAQLNGALTVLQTIDMAHAQLFDQVVHGFFQGFHFQCHRTVVICERGEGFGHGFLQGGNENTELCITGVGEVQTLFVQFLRGFLNVQSMIADPFKVTDGVEQAGNRVDILHGNAVLGNLYQIIAEMILVNIQLVLDFIDEDGAIFPVIVELFQRIQQAFVS